MTHIRLILISAVILACGGGGGGSQDPPTGPTPPGSGPDPQPAPATAQVNMRSDNDIYGEVNSFVPASVTIRSGGQVTWTNATGLLHNVTFSGTNAPANVPEFGSGSRERTFPSAGTYGYQCTLHAQMTGQVVVQ